MTRYSAPLLIAATMYSMTLPAPALAHGLPSSTVARRASSSEEK
jgi:hypothetical protein